jgi:hypothetical protein
MNSIDKKFYTRLSESHRPDLHPNGKIVRCIEDKGNGYLVVTTNEEIEPNTWITHISQLKETIESYE